MAYISTADSTFSHRPQFTLFNPPPPLPPPQKFCITIVFDFPYDGCITEEIGVNNEKYLEKLETMVTQHFGGG